jgi:hypothetical protein
MVNYQLGKIYIITSETNKLLYVGSTAQLYISTRLQGHIKDFKQGRISCCSFKLMDCEDYNIKLLKEFPCCNKKQLEREEGFWILHYKEQTDYTCVNKNIAGRTNKEWREANKEYISDYLEANKDHISLRGKGYREANKNHIAEYSKIYYIANEARIKEKHECSCGGKYTTRNKLRHEKTTLHQEYLKTQNK